MSALAAGRGVVTRALYMVITRRQALFAAGNERFPKSYRIWYISRQFPRV